MRIILILIIFSLFAISCKKNEFSFVLKGKVEDKSFSSFLNGAEVTLEEVLSPGESSDDILHTTTVNTDGTYELKFSRKKAVKYLLKISKENYFEIEDEISFSDFSTEKPLEKDYSTTAKAWVKLVFINDLPSSPTDEFKYTKQLGKQACSICCPISEQIIYGTENQEVLCVNDGNSMYSYYYLATNPAANGFEEIYTPAFDTVELVKHW